MVEILVNAKTSPLPPAIAGIPSPDILTEGHGGLAFVVVWQDVGEVDLKGQIIHTDGEKRGGEFLINTTRGGTHTLPAIATVFAGGDLGFVVAWIADLGPSTPVILLQRFAPDGTKRGGEILVSASEVDPSHRPAIARLRTEFFVVSWVSGIRDEGIRAQVLAPDGTRVGDEFRVNTSDGVHIGPVLTAPLEEGDRFVIAWQGGPNFESTTARLQVFDTPGFKLGPEKILDLDAHRGMAMCSVRGEPFNVAAGFVIVHVALVGEGEFGEQIVKASVFDPDGSPAPPPSLREFNVTERADQSIGRQPAAAARPNQGFVVAWTDRKLPHTGDTSEDNIMAEFCTMQGPRSSSRSVNATPAGNQNSPCVAAILSEGHEFVAFAWVDDSVSGPGSSFPAVKARILTEAEI